MIRKRLGASNALRYLCLLFVIALGFATIVATGGGGGSGSESSSAPRSVGDTGSVAVLLTDGAADDYEEINICVTQVSLIPAPGHGPDPVVIFDCPDGYCVNLLDYRNKDFFLTRTDDVPEGQYEKVRLEVKEITSDPPCDGDKGWKLPSKKIDLNPRGPFEVQPGETLLIRLDMDLDKSINAHPAGKSGKCMFRPVVFVDIEALMLPQPCPLIVSGVVSEPIDRDENEAIEAFTLRFPDRPGTLPVELNYQTMVFLDDASVGDSSDLEEEQMVWVRGSLDGEGRLQAYQIIIGDVSKVEGTLTSPAEGGAFSLLPDDEAVPVDVMLSNSSLLFLRCDTASSEDDIQPGLKAEVFGKDSQNVLLAIFVFLQPQEISGELVAVKPVDNGDSLIGKDLYLTIQPEVGDPKILFFPQFTRIYLEGNGEIHVNFLCQGRQLTSFLDPGEPELAALEVRIQPETVEGEVLNHISGQVERTLLLQLEGQPDLFTVHVEKGATILDVRGDENTWLDFDEIQIFDQVQCYGLSPCPEDSGFYAFVILVVGPETESLVIDWANLQSPPFMVHTISALNPTENIYGLVWIDGYTQTIGPTPGLLAQVGYGPDGSDPEGNASWLWFDAEFEDDVGGNDEFRGQLVPEAVGTFDYAYRYSIDEGSTWVYADLDGTGNGYEPTQAGDLNVNPAGDTTPPEYPQNLVSTATSSSSISLAWDALVDSDLFRYEVYRGDAVGGPYAKIADVPPETTVYSDLDVIAEATYFYVVKSVDTSFNKSNDSNEVQATAEGGTT